MTTSQCTCRVSKVLMSALNRRRCCCIRNKTKAARQVGPALLSKQDPDRSKNCENMKELSNFLKFEVNSRERSLGVT